GPGQRLDPRDRRGPLRRRRHRAAPGRPAVRVGPPAQAGRRRRGQGRPVRGQVDGRVTALEQAQATEDGYTVEALARPTGATVRTMRWYQSEGLLPAPRRSGRVALYDDDHVARLEAIRELQGHGLTLVAVRRLLDQAPGSAATAALAFVRSAVADLGDGAEVV